MLQHHQLREVVDHSVEAFHGKVNSSRLGIILVAERYVRTEVLDHLGEFATLKAMGYGDRYIQLAVLVESALLSILGFIPSIVIGAGMLSLLGWSSGLPAGVGIADMLKVGALALSMCTFAGILALRKVRNLDPAELF